MTLETSDDELSSLGPTSLAITRYAGALLLTAFATGIAVGVDRQVAIPNLSLVFVVPVIVSGVSLGLGPSLFAAVLGALSYNFFLVEPRYSLMVDDPANIWAICLLFAVGVITSTVSFTSGRRAEEVASLRKQLKVLNRFSRDVTTADTPEAVVTMTSRALTSLFGLPSVAMLVAHERTLAVRSTGPMQPSEAEIETARSSLSTGDAVHAGVYPDVASRFDFWPVKTQKGASAVLGIAFEVGERPTTADAAAALVGRVLALSLEREEMSRYGQ